MKYFIVSDIHSFCTELKEGLKKAGFSKTNKDHILVVLGDLFDRGYETTEVYEFIKSIPKKRRILVQGNHELLYFELLKKDYPQSHDFSNCTVDTFCHIAAEVFAQDEATVGYLNWCYSGYFEANYMSESRYYMFDDDTTYNMTRRRWSYVVEAVKNHPITKWLKSKEWKHYYELDKYIFVHSFIPTKLKKEVLDTYGMVAYGFENPACFEFDPNWRESSDIDWNEATWGCPYEKYRAGLFSGEEEQDKVLVCGHWHTSAFFKHLNHIHLINEHPIYYSTHLIAIDGGVRYSQTVPGELEHEQNVLVIDDSDFNTCYDQNRKKLINVLERNSVPIIETVTIGENKDE